MFVALLILAGCTKDDEAPTLPPQEAPEPPVLDEFFTLYNGKIAALASNDYLIGYLMKRFKNTEVQLSKESDAVLLDETTAIGIANDTEQWAILKNLWRQNKSIIIVNPGQNTLNMIAQLRANMLGSEYSEVSSDVVASYENVHLYIARADGNALICQRIDNQHKQAEIASSGRENENDEPEVSTDIRNEVISYEPTDYEIGRIAEAASKWLNKHHRSGANTMLTDSSTESHPGNQVTITLHSTIQVYHDMASRYKWCRSYDDYPRGKSTEVTTRINVIAGYSEELEADVYDVNLDQYFDGAQTCVEFFTVWEHLAYNWRYSGGYYYGPTIELNLKTGDNSSFTIENNTELLSPAPVPSAGSYNIAHNPMTVSFNGGITGGASVGASGMEANASGNFGFMVTLPSTTVSEVVSDMPLTYESTRSSLKWTFKTDWELHNIHWGVNPDFRNPPLITHNGYPTSQAVSFVVYNSKTLGTEPLYIDYKVDYKTYHELGRAEIENHDAYSHTSPTDVYKELISHIVTFPSLQMPSIPRYFKDYTPACIYTDGMADGDGGWSSLEEMLNDNIYYKTFEEDAKIRSVTEEGLNEVAEEAWHEALTSLVATYSGTQTNSSYIIGLTYDVTKHLSLGLYIHDGVWEIITDVDAKKAELTNTSGQE